MNNIDNEKYKANSVCALFSLLVEASSSFCIAWRNRIPARPDGSPSKPLPFCTHKTASFENIKDEAKFIRNVCMEVHTYFLLKLGAYHTPQ